MRQENLCNKLACTTSYCHVDGMLTKLARDLCLKRFQSYQLVVATADEEALFVYDAHEELLFVSDVDRDPLFIAAAYEDLSS